MIKGPVYRQREARELTAAKKDTFYGLCLIAKKRVAWQEQK